MKNNFFSSLKEYSKTPDLGDLLGIKLRNQASVILFLTKLDGPRFSGFNLLTIPEPKLTNVIEAYVSLRKNKLKTINFLKMMTRSGYSQITLDVKNIIPPIYYISPEDIKKLL